MWDWSGGAEVVEAGKHIGVGERNHSGGSVLWHFCKVLQGLGESCGVGIDPRLAFILFFIANVKNSVEWGGAPGLAHGEAG